MRICFIMAFLFCSCRLAAQNRGAYRANLNGTAAIAIVPTAVGDTILGDFDGDGTIETAYVVRVRVGQGNPVEDGIADEYQIQFAGDRLKPIDAGCCELRLINEGDLNNDGTDEISIFQSPINGCTYTMAAFTFKQGAWEPLVPPFLIPTACAPFSDADLQNRIFVQQGSIYYYEKDMSRENGKLIKRRVP